MIYLVCGFLKYVGEKTSSMKRKFSVMEFFCHLLMLYSVCMKFQAELINFQNQLENRVLCKTFPSRQNSEIQLSVTKHEELKNAFE